MNAHAISGYALQFTTIAIALASIALIIPPLRRYALRLLAVAVILAVAACVAPFFLGKRTMIHFLPDAFIFSAAVLGLVLAVACRAYSWALYLLTPAIVHWLIWPLLAPILWSAIASVPVWALVLLLPILTLAAIFAAIKMLQTAITTIYGKSVSARVTGYALFSTLRTIGRVFTWPIRAIKNRQTMDDMLRQWRP